MAAEPSSKGMDGRRIREFLSADVSTLLQTYEQFEKLIPHESRAGAAHAGEDGRYVEALVRTYLRKYLPKNLECLTGFILRPAVKAGKNGRERKGQEDQKSTQLDIIIYDTANFPIYQRFGDDVIVPPEGVVCVCSVKKHLRRDDIAKESEQLRRVAQLCSTATNDDRPRRGPFLCLITMRVAQDWQPTPSHSKLWECLKSAPIGDGTASFDELIGYMGILDGGSIFKKRPEGNPVDAAQYVWLKHKDKELYLGLQFLLTGVLSVYYDETRSTIRRPGFTGFESGRGHDEVLGKLPATGLNAVFIP